MCASIAYRFTQFESLMAAPLILEACVLYLSASTLILDEMLVWTANKADSDPLLQEGRRRCCKLDQYCGNKASDDVNEGKPMFELARDAAAAGIVAVIVVDHDGALERGMGYEGSVLSVFKADDGY